MIFRSRVCLNVQGKNINRFIKKLMTRKIEILSLKYISENEAEIVVYNSDYETILKIKSIYEVLEKDVFGYLKIKKMLRVNKYLIMAFIFSYLLFILLTHIIFDIEVVHSNRDLRNLIMEELDANGIRKYTFKKSYDSLEKIKENILNKHPDKIEWLEIETIGTKYVIRAEEREIISDTESNAPRHIVAKKDAVIKKVIANTGDILRNTDDYVKKGDIVINGEIMLNEKSMGKVRASGKVYGEVWYVIKTEYPFVYYEEQETGRKKDVYTIKFLNHDFEFTFDRFINKKGDDEVIVSHSLLPIKFVLSHQKEINVKSHILTFDEALIKAKEESISKVEKQLGEDGYIIRSKYLKSKVNDNNIEVEMFFAVYEDITDYKEIK